MGAVPYLSSRFSLPLVCFAVLPFLANASPIRNGQSLPDLLASASSLRSDVTLGTGAVEDYASAVMRVSSHLPFTSFLLLQCGVHALDLQLEVEQNSPSEQTVLRSTFTIVDLAGAEKLVNDPAKLKATVSSFPTPSLRAI